MRSALILCLLGSTAIAGDPRFEPRDAPHHVYSGGWEHFVGGGVAAFDCNADALPDLYVAGGDNPAQLMRNTSSPSVSFVADTPDTLALTGVIGAYPLNIDGDTHADLVILRVGPDAIVRGIGDCQFEPFDLGFQSGDHWTTAFSATWETGQTLPTLAFGTYVDRADPKGPFQTCDDTLLYRPDGDGYGTPETLSPGFCALSMLFSDWSRDGRADLRVSNDRHYYVRGGQEQMWAMEDTPRLYTAEEGWKPYSIWGMGIASRDMNGDGFSDVYLTSMGDQKFQYFDPETGGPTYVDATYARGTTAHRPHLGEDGRPSTGWHAAFGDVNNDLRDDVFVAKGNVEQMPDAAMQDPNTLLIQGTDGVFSEMAGPAGLASMARSRGAALADFNRDGLLDLAVVNRRVPMEIYENVTDGGNWLSVQLTGAHPNTSAIGAHIEVCAPHGTDCQTREVMVGGGHAGGTLGSHHFGLGDLNAARLRVIWPDLSKTDWQDVSVNEEVIVNR
ncbi:CRTAC1 family protein [uncultured Pelagimonas sp.]|uniref:CRTAC1 family protein n=1 Tax=uncultured Pelagimonas sp. TaxID=1618102 RepID=UPI0026032555|nr:CRTAC1 family protein [uncultured Pelagimonas sp.]